MTVAELIDVLGAYDPEAEVVTLDTLEGVYDDINEVWRKDDGKVVIW